MGPLARPSHRSEDEIEKAHINSTDFGALERIFWLTIALGGLMLQSNIAEANLVVTTSRAGKYSEENAREGFGKRL